MRRAGDVSDNGGGAVSTHSRVEAIEDATLLAVGEMCDVVDACRSEDREEGLMARRVPTSRQYI